MATLKVIWNQEVREAEGAGGNSIVPPYIAHRYVLVTLGAVIFEEEHFGIDFGEEEIEINIEGTEMQLALFKRCLDNGQWPSEEEIGSSMRELLLAEIKAEHSEVNLHYLGDIKRIASSIEIVS